MSAMTNKRNGTIELLRFLFCLVVILFHVSNDVYGEGHNNEGIFHLGAISVDYFLMLSGYFMAVNIQKKESKKVIDIVSETEEFMRKKIHSVIAYHFAFNLFIYIYFLIAKNLKPDDMINRLSSFLFLDTVGFNSGNWNMAPEWYIGCMLLVLLITYPILRKWFRIVSSYVAPILAIVFYGCLRIADYSSTALYRFIWAVSGILLGIALYPAVQRLKRTELNRFFQRLLGIISFCGIVSFFLYMASGLSRSLRPLFILFLGGMLTISLAEKGLFSSTGVLNHRFIYYLGNISISIYMIQNIPRVLFLDLYNGNQKNMMILETAAIIFAGVAAFLCKARYDSFLQGKERKQKVVTRVAVLSLIALTATITALLVNSTKPAPVQSALDNNQFIVYYHPGDNEPASEKITLVTYGNNTPLRTVEQLGFKKEGMDFSGWKIFRTDQQKWVFEDNKGNKSLSKWRKHNTIYSLYEDGSMVSQTASAGYEVHLYAQWKNDTFTVYYHLTDEEAAYELTTAVHYGNNTPIRRVSDLGFSIPGKQFTGWKVYRSDTDCWRLVDNNGTQFWGKADKPEDISFFLYRDGQSIAKTASEGAEVHLYGQWE